MSTTAATLLTAGIVGASIDSAASAATTPAGAGTAADPVPASDVVGFDANLAVGLRSVHLNEARQRLVKEALVAEARARKAKRAAKIKQLRARIIKVARNQIGDRYRAGSSGPSAFDCSGFTRYVYRVAAGKYLPHSSRTQYTKVKKITRKQAKPGDLVFFLRNGAHHVGIYLGKGRMVDAAGYGKGVRISPTSGSWWSRSYTGMGRVLPA